MTSSHRRRALVGIAGVIGAILIAVAAGCGGGGVSHGHSEGQGAGVPRDLAAEWPRTDFSRRAVSLDEISSGGPPKDGIPALDHPKFQNVRDMRYLKPSEPVIAVDVAGQVRAYPIQILIWHEIANDTLGSVPIAVTFRPLCNSAIVFDRRSGGQVLDFGTTGRLRHSDLVMRDRATESWWQQFTGESIVGARTGSRLRQLPARIVAWQEFRSRFPDATVLSRDTGFDRSYGTNPYSGYDEVDSSPLFPAPGTHDHRLAPKDRVVYFEANERAVAVPFKVLQKCRSVWSNLAATGSR